MKVIQLSFDHYPVKYYSKTMKSSNVLKLNGIGLKNYNTEQIKNIFKNFSINCIVYVIDTLEYIYIEFYRRKDCIKLFNFFNRNHNKHCIIKNGISNVTNSCISNESDKCVDRSIELLKLSDITAEYAHIKYEVKDNFSTEYMPDYQPLLNIHKDINVYESVCNPSLLEEINENYKNPQWLKYTQNNELNLGHYFCRCIPNKLYRSYCIEKLETFFSGQFMEYLRNAFKNKLPNQVSILNCQNKKSVDYVVESSFLFEDEIAFLVIGNSVPISFFDLRSNSKVNILAKHNTLITIRGRNRYELIFGIPKKRMGKIEKSDRQNSLLLIFRFVKENDLEDILTHKKHNNINKDPKQDSTCVPINVDEFGSKNLEKKYVMDVYDQIAQHFNHTRHRAWKNVENFINQAKKGSVIMDVGCGSGKHLNVSPKYFYIGLDFSIHLLKIAKKKDNSDLFLANCINIPIQSNTADLTISIAVIHHLGTHEKRKIALEEIVRCTKVNGKILIYVWAFEQQGHFIGNRQFESQDIFVPWHLQQQNATEFNEPENKTVTFKKELLKLQRYYHVFTKEEIYELCKNIQGVEIENMYFDCNNWAVILKKVSYLNEK